MIKKIKSSLCLKIFLLLATILFMVSFIIYGIIMAVVPNSYQSVAVSDYSDKVNQLVDELSDCMREEADTKIYDFCINNNAYAFLQGDTVSVAYGGENEDENADYTAETQSISYEIYFKDSNEKYILTLSVSEKAVSQITQTFWRILPIISAVILAVSLLGSYFISRFITRPVIEISNISKRLTDLDMTWRCNTKRTDEIGILSNSLNTMAEQLDSTLNALTIANQKLQKDIEKEREREKLQIDFFRAVSHELKTPITVLKGELEGMLYQVGDYQNRDLYLRESLKTADDMEDLVNEILSVSKMNDSNFALNISEINIGQLVRECSRKWQGIAEDQEQQFITDIDDFIFNGDIHLLQKAISNIIGNAVHHSPQKAVIKITLQDGILTVINGGVSISDFDIEQIFEPFYRVENSHNRKTGGSGLGLYIVKNTLEQHNLKHKIENTKQGVCFTIDFTQ